MRCSKTGSKSSNWPSWKGYTPLEHYARQFPPSTPSPSTDGEHTGNFHLVSHKAFIPAWCGITLSKASDPMSHVRGSTGPSIVCSAILTPVLPRFYMVSRLRNGTDDGAAVEQEAA